MSKISVGVIGCGYWGPNLIRNFAACPQTDLIAVCDADPTNLEKIGAIYDDVKLTRSVDQLLELELDAVAIATPVSTHFPIAKQCIEAGLHVLIEKPLADTVANSAALVKLADQHDRLLMVDHTYLFGNPIRKVKELIENDELGELNYVDGVRINLGLFQSDINVIWDLAPHDFSIVDNLLGIQAQSIAACGSTHADQSIEDIAYVHLDFGDQLMANFHVNWLSPVKVRQMIFAGKRRSLVFNELNVNEPIKVYDRGIDILHRDDDPADPAKHQLQIGYHAGDIWSPRVEPGEALQTMVSHFADCILHDEDCISDGEMGLRVVRYLDAATNSIRSGGKRLSIQNDDELLDADEALDTDDLLFDEEDDHENFKDSTAKRKLSANLR